jgi:LL-diaminopimelate aminotransferase
MAGRAKLLIVNYPNNPTGAVANEKFYHSLVRFGIEHNIVIVNDGAYMDICRDRSDSISLLQVPRAKETGVEFGTLSKSYNMTGWRLGYIAGNREVIDRLMIIKTNFDSGQFGALQMAGIEALRYGDESIKELNEIYEKRRRVLVPMLEDMGMEVFDSKGAFYIWFKVPKPYKSQEFASIILEKAGVIITPGNSFGTLGEGYCRISLTVETDRLEEAAGRIAAIRF